ncbi:MAG: magnesium/cobalt transporter CorA [Hyphomonadaceae bacterium]|nr:magnesium/cobalt transporter CorA [Clostridia bacterium]
MPKFTKKRSLKTGLPPGSLVHIGQYDNKNTMIEVFDYDLNTFTQYKYTENAIEKFELLPPVGEKQVRWINVDGLNNMDIIERICKSHHIHALVMEDVLNTSQRPKIENYDDYIYLVAKMVYFEQETMVDEQLSIILGKGYVISFGEREGDVFNQIRDRIRKNGIHLRGNGADYLAYSLLDAIVDGYFGVLEKLGDKIDDVEEQLLNHPSVEGLHKMRELKKDLLYMHRSVWPLREVTSWMERSESELIESTTQIYIRDIYDHIIQTIDTTETFRELLSGLMDIYLSSISNKMNEIMKFLTIISTIFIPLTFVVGLYGMNFKYMPELEWHYGYGAVIVAMALIAIAMVMFFKRRKWF